MEKTPRKMENAGKIGSIQNPFFLLFSPMAACATIFPREFFHATFQEKHR
jgi:hypothetical protein